MINTQEFIRYLIAIGSKASALARLIRNENSLFDLLIEEKQTTEYLKCDYKTFADVLIQETVRNDLAMLHPNLSEHFFGEENNEFTNKLNVTIKIKIGKTESDTEELILQVLDGHSELASILAVLIHKGVNQFIDDSIQLTVLQHDNIDVSDLGIWIDPIDGTAEYIHGLGLVDGQTIDSNAPSIGNATVLLGAFSLQTGVPFAGVVYQPFSYQDSERNWQHVCYWGINRNGTALYSDNIRSRKFTFPADAVTSKREVAYFSAALNGSQGLDKWHVTNKAGAGYKFVLILDGECDLYILSKGSTYEWDTCGPHAILLAMGGGVVDYQQVLREVHLMKSDCVQGQGHVDDLIRSLLTKCQLTYSVLSENNCNSKGFLAYSKVNVAISVINALLGDS